MLKGHAKEAGDAGLPRRQAPFIERKKVYISTRDCLAFFSRRADIQAYWEDVWKRSSQAGGGLPRMRLFSRAQQRFEPDRSGLVLEAGCGDGRVLRMMLAAGYEVHGVDLAATTVLRLRESLPEARVSVGDVRNVELPDRSVRSYWSVGVIEHFIEGYDAVASEAARLLAEGGHAFIAYPHMSPVRDLKLRRGRYAIAQTISKELEGVFNQYCLRDADVCRAFQSHGLRLVYSRPYGAVLGCIEELPLLRAPMTRLFGAQSQLARALRFGFEICFARSVGHTVLQVYEKTA